MARGSIRRVLGYGAVAAIAFSIGMASTVSAADDKNPIDRLARLEQQVTALVQQIGTVTGVAANLAAEVQARISADAALATSIANETTARTQSLATEAAARQQGDAAEATARSHGDAALAAADTAEANARAAAIAALSASTTSAISAEATTRAQADTAIDGRVTALESAAGSIQVVTAQGTAAGGSLATTRTEAYIEMEPIYAPIPPDGSAGYYVVGYREVTRYRTVSVPAVTVTATANAQCPAGKTPMAGYGIASQPSTSSRLAYDTRMADSTGAAASSPATASGWFTTATFSIEGTVYARAFCVAAP